MGTYVKGEEILTILPDVIKSGFESNELYYNYGLHGTDLVELLKS